jgi:uncharacterized protein
METTVASPVDTHEKTPSKRATFLMWLRKTHGWIGLWGATLGLIFGVTGFLLNHRNVLKIPAAQTQETTVQVALPSPPPQNAKELGTWLQKEMAWDTAATKVKEESSKAVALKQPARWTMTFVAPKTSLAVDYWVGNNYVSVKRSEGNFFAMLNNFHKGTGMSIGWILLVDTLAGSIILLSITGVILWTQLNRRRVIGASIGATSVLVTLGLIATSF